MRTVHSGWTVRLDSQPAPFLAADNSPLKSGELTSELIDKLNECGHQVGYFTLKIGTASTFPGREIVFLFLTDWL